MKIRTRGGKVRGLAAIVALLLSGSLALTAATPRCVGSPPPPINKPGFRPGAAIPFAVGDSPAGVPFPATRWRCVRRAFEAWTRANRAAGLDVRFVPGPDGIIVRFDRPGLLLRARNGGGWSDAVRGPDGALEQATIWISSDVELIDDCRGITKVVLHELGHLHGLADQPYYRGPSVMNRGLRRNDRGERIPMAPMNCDAWQAREAASLRGAIGVAGSE